MVKRAHSCPDVNPDVYRRISKGILRFTPSMKTISLNKDKYTLVDDEDFEYLNNLKWCVSTYGYAGKSQYIKNENKKATYTYISLARFLLESYGTDLTNKQIDHINLNKLDNRKSNLRTATRSQNKSNTKKRKDNTSGYKGVIWSRKDKRWEAKIGVNQHKKHLGRFLDKKDAAKSYNTAATKYFREYARLNNTGV